MLFRSVNRKVYRLLISSIYFIVTFAVTHSEHSKQQQQQPQQQSQQQLHTQQQHNQHSTARMESRKPITLRDSHVRNTTADTATAAAASKLTATETSGPQNGVQDLGSRRQLFGSPPPTQWPNSPNYMEVGYLGQQPSFVPYGAAANPLGLPVGTSAAPQATACLL